MRSTHHSRSATLSLIEDTGGWGGGAPRHLGRGNHSAPMVMNCHAHAGVRARAGYGEELQARRGSSGGRRRRVCAPQTVTAKTVILAWGCIDFTRKPTRISHTCAHAATGCVVSRTMRTRSPAPCFHEVHDLGLRGLKLQPPSPIRDAGRGAVVRGPSSTTRTSTRGVVRGVSPVLPERQFHYSAA